MKVGFIAYHYPHAPYRDEFAELCEGVGRVCRSAPGCISADDWITDDGASVVSIVRMESPEALEAAFATLQSAETRAALGAEFGPTPEGTADGTNEELFVRLHEVSSTGAGTSPRWSSRAVRRRPADLRGFTGRPVAGSGRADAGRCPNGQHRRPRWRPRVRSAGRSRPSAYRGGLRRGRSSPCGRPRAGQPR